MPGTAPPLVSVIMPAFNAAGTIRRAIASALAQEGVPLEVVVCDDVSRDDTAAVVAAMAEADPRIVLLRSERNGGAGEARNRCIAAARGDWIAVLDSDDAWRPGRAARLLDLAARTGADCVADDLLLHDAAAGREVGAALGRGADWPLDVAGFLRGAMTGTGGFDLGLLKPMVRRDFLETHGLRYDPAARNGQDFLFLLDILAAGARMQVAAEALYVYTEPTGSLSRTAGDGTRTRRYDYAGMRARNDAALERLWDRLSPEARRLMRRRGTSIASYDRYLRAMQALRERRWGAAAALADPRVWPMVAQAVRRRLAAKARLAA